MSSDQGSETPSFGDLFDDPHAPLLPVDPAGRGSLRPSPPTPRPAEASDPAGPAEPVETVNQAPEPESVAPFGDASGDATGEVEPVPAAEPADSTPADQPAAAPTSHEDAPDEGTSDEGTSDEDAAPIGETGDAPLAPPGIGTVTPAGDPSHEPVTGEPETADSPSGLHDARRPAPMAAAFAGAAAPAAWDGTPEPGISSAPSPRVDTGRLYRSAGAEGPATLDAIPAIDPAYLAARPPAVDVVPASTPATRAAEDASGSGLTYSGVAVVVISVTVLVGFAEAIITDKLGVLTGLALAASSIYAALVVRKADIWAAVVMPPLAFLAAALTAGQLTLDASGSLLVREGYMVFRTLAVNAPWILGTTLVCLVIVLVRRHRA